MVTRSDFALTSIHVLGAGVIGLFTAYCLLRSGYTNLTIVAEHFEELASHNAGGLLAPTYLEVDSSDSETAKLMDQICFDAYHFYAKVARGEHSDFPANAAKFVPAYFEAGKTSSLDPYAKAGVMKPAKQVLIQIGTNPREFPMCVFDDAIFIETAVMLHTLREFLHTNGVKFIQRRLHSLEELQSANVIVNCTGIGAKELCHDERMHSVQGHLILLRDQDPNDLNYMLVRWASWGKTEGGQDVERAFYIFPKSSAVDTGNRRDIGVIGGTFVLDADASTPNCGEFELVLERAKQFFGLHPMKEE